MDNVTQQQRDFKKYVSYIANSVFGLKETGVSAGRRGFHIRFGMTGDIRSISEKWQTYGVTISESDQALSEKYTTYVLTAEDASIIKTINPYRSIITKNTKIYWVNSVAGGSTSSLFRSKELTPDSLGASTLLGQNLTKSKLIEATTASLSSKYKPSIANELVKLLNYADTNLSSIQINPPLQFQTADINTIGKDFGEILCAVWLFNNQGLDYVKFPRVSNERLVDFSGVKDGLLKPVSVKSGAGSKVTITNIINFLEKDIELQNNHFHVSRLSTHPYYFVFDIIEKNSMKEGMLELHKKLNTDSVKELTEALGIRKENLSYFNLQNWVKNTSIPDIKLKLQKFYEVNKYGIPTNEIWNRVERGSADRMWIVISPLGESLYHILNEDEKIQEGLNDFAKKIQISQCNIILTQRTMKFQIRKFQDIKFEFGWAGYSAGNKLGFKAKKDVG